MQLIWMLPSSGHFFVWFVTISIVYCINKGDFNLHTLQKILGVKQVA